MTKIAMLERLFHDNHSRLFTAAELTRLFKDKRIYDTARRVQCVERVVKGVYRLRA
jgi:hypothetical protein